jgi:hypothetical protein
MVQLSILSVVRVNEFLIKLHRTREIEKESIPEPSEKVLWVMPTNSDTLVLIMYCALHKTSERVSSVKKYIRPLLFSLNFQLFQN